MASNNINTQSHFLRRRYETLTYFRRRLESEILSARLDVLCPHSCLSPMVVHRKTYILIFCDSCALHSSRDIWNVKFQRPTGSDSGSVEDVKLTRYSVFDALTALKIAMVNAKKLGYPCWMSNESTWFKGKCTLFYSCFGNCRRFANKISAYEVCIICPKLFVACKIHCKSPSRRPDGLTTLNWFTVHEANLSAYIRELAYGRSHLGCGRVHQTLLLHVPQIFQRRKSDANNQDFEIELNLAYRARSTPK